MSRRGTSVYSPLLAVLICLGTAPGCESDHDDGHGTTDGSSDGATDDHGDHGDHTGGGNGDHALTADACAIMTGDTHMAATATADVASAPDISAADGRLDVSLVDVDNGKGGYVHLSVTEAGDHLFFLSSHLTLEVVDADGTEHPTSAEDHTVSVCTDVMMYLTFALVEGEYDLFIGPTSLDSISVVHQVHAGDDHDHSDHAGVGVPEDYEGLSNPQTGDDAIGAGEALFGANCATCHGSDLGGDGAMAASLVPAPSELADPTFLNAVGDDYLYWRITAGGTMEPFVSSMPAFATALSDEERWQIVAFIRSHAAEHDADGDDDHPHDDDHGH